MQPASQSIGRCRACDYPLRALGDTRRCPECGHGFDPADPASMNLGAPVGALGRWMLKPVRPWPLLALGIAATALIASTTRWPLHSLDLRFVDWRIYFRWGDWHSRWMAADPHELAFALGLLLWAVAIVAWCGGAAVKAMWVRCRRWPVPPRSRRNLIPRALLTFLMIASALAIAAGWPYRVGAGLIGRELRLAPNVPPPPVWLKRADELLALQDLLIHGSTPRQRTAALKLLVDKEDHQGLPALPLLLDSLDRPMDPATRALLLRVIALHGFAAPIDRIEGFLSDPSPDVRAAAADAIGVLHDGLDDSQLWWRDSGPRTMTSDPPIKLDVLLKQWPPTPKHTWGQGPSDIARRKLATAMTSGQTQSEREAAARTVVTAPPAGYQLRLAEWGVWADDSGNGDNEEGRLRAELEQIPPFVHQSGDSIAAIARRTPFTRTINIWKPVIHLTANVPLAVDLRVRIRSGRPWYVYPHPDDFDLLAYFMPNRVFIGATPIDPDVPHLSKLSGLLHEGYPWLMPAHRPYLGQVSEAGFRWQSLIVSPSKLPWMSEASVPADRKYAWWNGLRNVECSWVSNRGESERFLYYDGPTTLKSPVKFTWRGDSGDRQLIVRSNGAPPTNEVGRSYLFWGGTRDGLLIEVTDDGAAGQRCTIPIGLDDSPEFQAGVPIRTKDKVEGSTGTIGLFRALIKEYGLTDSEASGMTQAWQHAFFETPGRRLLMVMKRQHYDAICPMQCRPPPTTSARVGIIWTELK